MKHVEYLQLLPCYHYWLAVHYGVDVTAICKKCKKTDTHTQEEWAEWSANGQALNKPTRV